MLTLHSAQSELIAHRRDGKWVELAPGADDGRYWAPDSAYFWIDEWEHIAEPIVAERLPGYDRHGRVSLDAALWVQPLAYVQDLCARLREAEIPEMVHVTASELPPGLLDDIARGFPAKRDELVRDLESLATWCSNALRRWKSITVIGL